MVLKADSSILKEFTVDWDVTGPSLALAIDDINVFLGPEAKLTDTDGGSFNDGTMVFEASLPGLGVAIVEDAVNPGMRAGRSFSHFFGLNDVMESRSTAHFETGITAGEFHKFGSGQLTLELRGPNN